MTYLQAYGRRIRPVPGIFSTTGFMRCTICYNGKLVGKFHHELPNIRAGTDY